MLDEKWVVLGPGEQSRVGLAGFVLRVGAVSEGFLHFTQGFLVLIRDLAVTLERNLEGADHSLDAV